MAANPDDIDAYEESERHIRYNENGDREGRKVATGTGHSEQIDLELRRIVHEAVSTRDVQSKIRECTLRVLSGQRRREQQSSAYGQQIREDQLVEELLRDGLVDLVKKQCALGLAKLSGTGVRAEESFVEDSMDDVLVVSVLRGQAFLEHADTEKEDFLPHLEPRFVLHANFLGVRISSRPVSSSADPQFNYVFKFKIPPEIENPLLLSEPIQLVLVKEMPEDRNVLVSSHQLKWQDLVLKSGTSEQGTIVAVEMGGVGASTGVPAGVLHIRSHLKRNSRVLPVDYEVTAAKLRSVHEDNTRSQRLFQFYAKQWWKEFLDIRPEHAFRLVKIFVPDECGASRLITLAVQVIRPERLIDTPREAARFVSLIPCQKTLGVGAGKVEQWSNPYTFLCTRVGDVENHTTLLCGLLLGLGVEAYVCVGTKVAHSGGTIEYAWVVSYGPNHEIWFWDALSGEKWKHGHGQNPGQRVSAADTVACIFNHSSFFANIQPSDCIDECSMDIANPSKWKAMSRDAIASIRNAFSSSASGIILQPNRIDVLSAASSLEIQLRGRISQHRRELGLGASWNGDISPILAQCLANYEAEKVSGSRDVSRTQEYQHAIKRAIPKGHTFKGFPVQFNHANTNQIMMEFQKDTTCSDILNARGDQVTHSLHVKIVPYPEDVIAVWVLLCVTYRSVL